MAAALRGVERVYLVTPSSQRAQDQQIRLAEAFVHAPPAAFAARCAASCRTGRSKGC